MRPFLTLVALALILSSCSVKEDRTECPCHLVLSVAGGKESNVSVDLWGTDLLLADRLEKDTDTLNLVMRVPRRVWVASAYSGVHGCKKSGHVLRIQESGQMDELYAGSRMVDCSGEEAGTEMYLHKQFAYLYINLVNSAGGDVPWYVKLVGNVCGVDLISLKPVEGPFSLLVHPLVGDYYRVCLPRQTDDSLTLEFYDSEMNPSGGPVGELPLGRMISDEGFDWHSADLDDIFLEIDYAHPELSVTILDWENIEL